MRTSVAGRQSRRDAPGREWGLMSSREGAEVSFEQFFQNSSDLMAIVRRGGVFELVNSAFHDTLGWDAEELIGNPYTSFIHPDDLEMVAASFDGDGVTIPTVVEMELRELCRDGSYRWMKWSIQRVGDLYYAVGHDITARKETMAALADSIQKSRAIFDAAVDSIIVIDQNLVIVEASPSNDEFFDLKKEDTEGRPAMDFVHPDDQSMVLAAIDRGFKNDEVVDVRFRGLQTNGRWATIESRGRALRDDAGNPTGAVIISRDISQTVDAELVLENALLEAEAANVAKSEFMSRMSHELRTPLNSVLGFAQILQIELESPEELEMIGYIIKSGGYLLELINEVLDISRVESGSIAVELELVSIHNLVHECVNLVTVQALDHGVELRNQCEEDHLVRADGQRLRQVLVNLLTNAIKYNHHGGTVTLTSDHGDGRVRLSVVDTGPGIAPQLHDRLFAPFDRLDAESKGIEGTGLGLALSRGLMEAIGGSLGVESDVGTGSTFWLELPIAPTPSPPEVHPTHNPHPSPLATSPESVDATLLYIEDNIGNVRLIQRLLVHRPNVRIITSLEGIAGLEMARDERPDLILLDVHLPDISGFDLLRQLRDDERTASIPVVMLSADASLEQIQRFSDAGARDYLTKPLDLRYFLTLLDNYLRELALSSD